MPVLSPGDLPNPDIEPRSPALPADSLPTELQSQKRQNDLCSFPNKPFSITVIQVYAPTSNAEEAEVERINEDLQHIIEVTPKKGVLFFFS